MEIQLSAFNTHLISFLKRDFSEGTSGITDRITAVAAHFNNLNH